jgi:type IV pilus assembly protein PilO
MAGLDLGNRPWWVALIIGAVMAGALVWAVETYIFTDISNEITSKQAELDKLLKDVNEGKVAEGRLPQFREEFQRLDTELQRLLRILPTAKQTDEMIKKIKSLTERGAFRLRSFQPQAFVKKEFYQEWPLNVSLDATYHELAMFFDRLSRFSRIINVESLNIAVGPQRKGGYTISTNFTMKTFIYGDSQQGGAR